MRQHIIVCRNTVLLVSMGSVLHEHYEYLRKEEFVKVCRNKKKQVRGHDYPWYKSIK